VAGCQAVHKPTDGKILDHGAVAVEQHDRLALAALDVVQTYAINIEEPAHRRGLALGSPGFLPVIQNGGTQCCG
jgi:hypothetical protein